MEELGDEFRFPTAKYRRFSYAELAYILEVDIDHESMLNDILKAMVDGGVLQKKLAPTASVVHIGWSTINLSPDDMKQRSRVIQRSFAQNVANVSTSFSGFDWPFQPHSVRQYNPEEPDAKSTKVVDSDGNHKNALSLVDIFKLVSLPDSEDNMTRSLVAQSVFFDRVTGKIHIVHKDDSAGSKDDNDKVRTTDGPITTLMRNMSVCPQHWVLQFAHKVLCLDTESINRLARSVDRQYQLSWTDANFDVQTWTIESPNQSINISEFLRSLDDQDSCQNAQSASSILAEHSNLILSKERVDANEKS